MHYHMRTGLTSVPHAGSVVRPGQETLSTRITAVRVLRLTGTMRTDGALWEEQLVHPLAPAAGMLQQPEEPGLGMQLDPAKFEPEEEIQRIGDPSQFRDVTRSRLVIA